MGIDIDYVIPVVGPKHCYVHELRAKLQIGRVHESFSDQTFTCNNTTIREDDLLKCNVNENVKEVIYVLQHLPDEQLIDIIYFEPNNKQIVALIMTLNEAEYRQMVINEKN